MIETGIVSLVILICAFFGMLLSAPIIRKMERTKAQIEIIQHGCAERVMTDSLTGETGFRWKSTPSLLKEAP